MPKHFFQKGNKINLGRHHTEETKKKMSNSHKGLNNWSKGRKLSEERKENLRKIFKGRKITWGNKISNALKGHLVSNETRQKISQNNLGKIAWNKGKIGIYSRESRIKMSIAKKGKYVGKLASNYRGGKMIICPICGKEKYKYPRNFKKCKNQFCSRKCAYQSFKGKHHSPNSEIKKGQYAGEKSLSWKGGITPINNKLRGSEIGRIWIKSVFARDNYTCQKCGLKIKNNLTAHHIQNFSQYPELRFAIDNGITFCRNCHKEFHKIFGKQNNNKKQIIKYLKV